MRVLLYELTWKHQDVVIPSAWLITSAASSFLHWAHQNPLLCMFPSRHLTSCLYYLNAIIVYGPFPFKHIALSVLFTQCVTVFVLKYALKRQR